MNNPTATLIADFRSAAEEIEARLAPSACATIASHNWIVIDDFGPLKFELAPEDGKHRATCTGHGSAHKVNRFTKTDAEHLARACTNSGPTLRAKRPRRCGTTSRRLRPSGPPEPEPAGPAPRQPPSRGSRQ